VESLTARAERALLGAIIADPGLAGRLGYLRPADFDDAWNRLVYSAILVARRDHPPVPDGWREAIIRAAGPGVVAREDLDALVGDCPDPGHGAAYGAMVVQGGALAILREQARELAARARQLAGSAGRQGLGHGVAGLEAGVAAGHLGRVAAAIRQHADDLGPTAGHAALSGELGVSGVRARREELVLAALLRLGRTAARALAERLPASVFSDPYRRVVFETIAAMRQAGRPVDALTVDWELARAGLPLYDRPDAGADGIGTETFAMRLARAEVTDEQAMTAVSALGGGQSRGIGRRAAPDPAPPWGRGPQRGHGMPGQVPSLDGEGAKPSRAVQRPPGRRSDGPDRGPQQAR
jgi:DnaB helicase-like protein